MKSFFTRLFFENNQLSQIIFKNTSWMLLANIIAKLFKFGLMIVIARELGPSLFGNFNYIIILSGTCFILSDIGLNLLIIRNLQEEKTQSPTLISTGFSIKLILILVSILIAIPLYFLMDPVLKLPFLIFSIMNIVDGIKQYWITLNRAKLKQEIEAISFIIETSLTSTLGIIVALQSNSLELLATSYLIGSSFALFFTYFKTKDMLPPLKKTSLKLLKKLLLKLAPFAISMILATAISNVDILMIKWLLNSKEVGFYSSGVKAAEVMIILPILLSSTIYPLLSKYINEKNIFTKILQESLMFLCMIGMPICLGGLLLAPEIITLIFSKNYLESVTTFQILLISNLLLFWFFPINSALLSLKEEYRCIKNSSIACLLNILLNILLIPKYGIEGAAFGSLLSRGILLSLFFYNLKNKIRKNTFITKRNLSYPLLSIIMVGIIYLSSFVIESLLFLIIIGIASYTILLRLNKDPLIKKLENILNFKTPST